VSSALWYCNRNVVVAISVWANVAIRDVAYKQRMEHLEVRAQGQDARHHQHAVLQLLED